VFNVVQDPWREFVKEEEFHAEDVGHERVNEKGGTIHFTASLKRVSADRKNVSLADYKIELNPAELGPSCSFARRYGSKSFFRLKLGKGLVQADNSTLPDFLRKPIILCNSVYRAFHGKEQTVFYFKTNERWDAARAVILPDRTPLGLGLREFLTWHNPMIEKNNRQVINVYRYTGLSLIPFLDNGEVGSSLFSGFVEFCAWNHIGRRSYRNH